MLHPLRDITTGHVRIGGGRKCDTCDHGLSRRSLRVKPPTVRVELEVKLMNKKERKRHAYIIYQGTREGTKVFNSTGIPRGDLMQPPRSAVYNSAQM